MKRTYTRIPEHDTRVSRGDVSDHDAWLPDDGSDIIWWTKPGADANRPEAGGAS